MTENEEQYKSGRNPVRFPKRLQELSKQGRSIPDAVPYPNDRLRFVVNNQLVVNLEEPLARRDATLYLSGTDARDRTYRQSVAVRIKRVSHCNPNLVLLEGIGQEQAHLLTGDVVAKYSPEEDIPPPKVRSSSANDIRYSPEEDIPPPKVRASSGGGDVQVDYEPASFDAQLKRISANSAQWATYPIVAVMDTGIDFAYPNTKDIPIQYNGGRPMCGTSFEADYIGWDFVHDQNYPYDDDQHNKHGSRIAAIISRVLKDQVRILPLKVIDKEGFGTLFNIFCGFEYVLSDQLPERPKVINASWGFYTQYDNPMLADYLDRLKDKRIWLVNAAGNRGDVYEGVTVNLDVERRLPACASQHHPNVLTITTVSRLRKLGYQIVENHSSTFVNAGIGSGTDGRFREPLVDGNFPQVKGSSYAAPYASAFAALNYQAPNDLATRNNLLQAMPYKEVVPELTTGISAGFIVKVE